MKTRKPTGARLVGHYFIDHRNANKDRCPDQGKIISLVAPGVFMVQLFGWAMGELAERRQPARRERE